MRIEFGRRCSMMKEAMSLLELAVNRNEAEWRRYLSAPERFGQEMESGILLQKELLELAGKIPVTEPMRRYLEYYQEKGLGCPARNLVCTFGAEETDSVEEMKKTVLRGLSRYSFDSFPDFSSYSPSDRELPLEGEPAGFLPSVKKLELEEKFKARLIFTFQDPEESLEELGELLSRAAELLEPFRSRMEAEEEKRERYWRDYFDSHSLEEFLSLAGVDLENCSYDRVLIRWNAAGGMYLSLDVGEDGKDDGCLKISMGVLMNEKLIRSIKKGDGDRALELMADPVKREILLYIRQTPHFGRELAEHFGLTTATISYHMQELLNEGLVVVHQQGKRSYYSLNRERVREVLDWMERLFLNWN